MLLGVGVAVLIACHSTRNERKAGKGYPPEQYFSPPQRHRYNRSKSAPVLPYTYANQALQMPAGSSHRTKPPGRRSMVGHP